MTAERPTSLRRKPRAAADESIDPIDPRPASPAAASPAVPELQQTATQVSQPAGPAYLPAPQASRAVRETTVQLSVKVAPDVVQLLDAAIQAARARGERLTQRAAIELAIRNTWG